MKLFGSKDDHEHDWITVRTERGYHMTSNEVGIVIIEEKTEYEECQKDECDANGHTNRGPSRKMTVPWVELGEWEDINGWEDVHE